MCFYRSNRLLIVYFYLYYPVYPASPQNTPDAVCHISIRGVAICGQICARKKCRQRRSWPFFLFYTPYIKFLWKIVFFDKSITNPLTSVVFRCILFLFIGYIIKYKNSSATALHLQGGSNPQEDNPNEPIGDHTGHPACNDHRLCIR